MPSSIKDRYTVVIPVLDQLTYTRQCVETLQAEGVPPDAILVIDNGSQDGTPQWLAAQPRLRHVRNPVNLGCGAAWTQGCMLTDSEWVVLLNNDVISGPRAIGRLIDAAERERLDVVSPALVEGDLDYDFQSHAQLFNERMTGVVRPGWFHGVCFAVRRRVLHVIGFPDTDRRLGGREDTEYLVRCLREGVRVGAVGDALFHHFGSITQKAIKLETSQSDLGDRHHFYARVGMGWWARKRFKQLRRQQARRWAEAERAERGFALHMQRQNGAWVDVKYL